MSVYVFLIIERIIIKCRMNLEIRVNIGKTFFSKPVLKKSQNKAEESGYKPKRFSFSSFKLMLCHFF